MTEQPRGSEERPAPEPASRSRFVVALGGSALAPAEASGGEEGAPADSAPRTGVPLVDRLGSKAGNLVRLLASDIPIPDGFVLTTDAFERFIAANEFDGEADVDAVSDASMPPEVEADLADATRALGDVPVAVRSSGEAEDREDASFAGQYETILGVRGVEEVAAAVRRCWSSALSRRVRAYRDARAVGPGRMAVLVQRLVAADAAGVAFTANPVTGDRDEVVVSAVNGLGERLVSGEASPDEWVVRGAEASCEHSPEGAIDAHQAVAVAHLARRVEAVFGRPQDIEWAIAEGRLFLLQARPITALPEPAPAPVPIPADPPPGFWERDVTHSPRPLSPMFSRLDCENVNAAFRRTFAEAGLLLEGIEFREIGGYIYTRAVPFGGKDGPAPPAPIMWLAVRLLPSLRARLQRCVQMVRNDEPGDTIRRWHEEWQPALAAAIREYRAVELVALSGDALRAHCVDLMRFLRRCMDIHFRLTIPYAVALWELVSTCHESLGWDEGRALALLSGLSEKSSQPARRLADLARLARKRAPIRALLEDITAETPERLADADPEFARNFTEYMREFGGRALRLELSDPTIAEMPSLVLRMIRDQLALGYDPAAEEAALRRAREQGAAEARAALSSAPKHDRERFERVLARAERAYPVREDNEFYTYSAPLALIRYAALELGRRLMQRGQIGATEDVFFLELEEALEALGRGDDQTALVRRRKGERAWAEAHPGRPSFGEDPGPPPSFRVLPREARLVHEAITWVLERTLAQKRSGLRHEADGTGLRGIPASPGRYTGTVRVVMDEDEFGKLEAGDILVCPMTSPVWSVLFPIIGALVTDSGGILSHPAIIAREFEVPAVVATGNATEVLRDGQMATVDGSTGRIEIAGASRGKS